MQVANSILDSFSHCIYLALLGNVLASDNSLNSIFHTREVLVVILVQCFCLGNRFIYFGVVSVLVFQGINRFFNSLCHLVHFCLLSNVLASDNSLNSIFHTGEVLVVILVQCFCLGNRFIYFGVVSVLVFQGINRFFNSLCHLVHFCLLSNVLASDNSLNSIFHTGEVLVVILVQCFCLGNRFIYFGVVSVLVFQGINRFFNSLCHLVHFCLLSNVLASDNSLNSIFHTGEVLVVILVQCFCLGNRFIYFGVVSVLVFQGINRFFNSLCHLVHFCLLSNVLASDNSLNSIFHTGEVLVVILVQCFCLGNGFINLSVISSLVFQGINRFFNSLCHLVHF